MKFKFKTKKLIKEIERDVKSSIGPKKLGEIKTVARELNGVITHHPKFEKLSSALKEKISKATDSTIGICEDKSYPQNLILVCGTKMEFGGKKKVFIGDSDRNDFISVENSLKDGDIDFSTLRVFFHSLKDLNDMSVDQRRKVAKKLNGRMLKDAAKIWELPDRQFGDVKHLSRFVNFIQDKRKTLTKSEAKDCRTNGCTAVPDFDIKNCCDLHDICYCWGGTEDDRYTCDKSFYDCMKKKDFPLAWLYYQGVRIFGVFRFNYK